MLHAIILPKPLTTPFTAELLHHYLDNILAGRSYINFHTNQFTGGEIRGQIVVVPEPGTLALLGSGFVLLGGAVIRGRRRS